MILPNTAVTKLRLCTDFASFKRACPQGVYITPVPEEPLTWAGVLFVRKGPYANAVIRFRIDFTEDYPERPPVFRLLSDVFHPLVTPLTTYTHSTREPGTDTVSSGDEDRLPPGGFTLRHGFPEWFEAAEMYTREVSSADTGRNSLTAAGNSSESANGNDQRQFRAPHIVEILQYFRIAFDTDTLLDEVPLEAAANSGAWHAWRTYRATTAPNGTSPAGHSAGKPSGTHSEGTNSPRQQPGGARRPGEWNWQGVWEDRVRKSVAATNSEPVLFGADGNDVINFLKMDVETLSKAMGSTDISTAIAAVGN